MDFIAVLEEKIEQVAARLEASREEIAELKAQVRSLEKENAGLKERAEAAPPAEFLQWQDEKARLRERIEAAIAKLEPLVGE
jgi:FtsZ-binding cell division protein ZapB